MGSEKLGTVQSGRVSPASTNSSPGMARRVAAPVGTTRAMQHPVAIFQDFINNHVWRDQALTAFESHSFTGAPGTERWCSRCTLMLAPDWKDPKKPVPPLCGDPRILPVPAVYEYVDGNPLGGIELSQPDYAGAKLKEG